MLIRIGARLIAALPGPWRRFASRRTGDLFAALFRGYRWRIARRNMELALPELTPFERAACARRLLDHSGRILFDTMHLLTLSEKPLERYVTVDGEEHLHELRGRPVIMIVPHMLAMVIGGYVLARRNHPILVSYKAKVLSYIPEVFCSKENPPDPAPGLEHISRYRLCNESYMININERGSLRIILQFLRANGILYYLPDIALGRKQDVPSLFMGQPVYMPKALFRLAKQNRAASVICHCTWEAESRYRLHISPLLSDFPTDDAPRDADRVNQSLNRIVRRNPDQYFWYHRRFKNKGSGLRTDDPYAGI